MNSGDLCALCQNSKPLLESHIIPSFVFKWLKGRSATGHIRNTERPNIRVQDGLKKPLLCGECESNFNRVETLFANKLFHPWLNGEQTIHYDDWMLKFCVSISWRVLKHCKGLNQNHVYTQQQDDLSAKAEETWRKFLLGELPHPASFEQHFLPVDIINETTIPDLPTNINRFLTGAITMDIVGSNKTLMTFAKLGRFIIFGFIQTEKEKWQGTKVHVKHGVIQPTKYVLPCGVWYLLKEKAALAQAGYESISDNQFEKIDSAAIANIDKFIGSDHLRAIMADADMFGEHVVLRKQKL